MRLVHRWLSNTVSERPRLEVVSALLFAPLVEEAVFRAAVFRLVGAGSARRVPAALASAAMFALMHRRFGGGFMAYAFVGGLVLWAAFARSGYPGAVLLHAAANVVDLSSGWRRSLVSRRTSA